VATLPAQIANGRTRDLVANLAGASPRTVQDVMTVHEHDPALFEQVARGEIAAHKAARRTRRQLRDADLSASPPLPAGSFDLIYADPPWRFPGNPDSSRAVENHYPTMELAEILALTPPAADNSLLFLWGVNSQLPQALHVIDAWGFAYVTQFVWVKDKWGLGQYNRCQHELLLVARRGSFPPPDEDRRRSSVIDARRRRHSEKPEQVRELLEQMYPAATKLELFARGKARPGWTIWGNQAEPEETA
jgi:N6-adenosine-specific RNA methylase IME4